MMQLDKVVQDCTADRECCSNVLCTAVQDEQFKGMPKLEPPKVDLSNRVEQPLQRGSNRNVWSDIFAASTDVPTKSSEPPVKAAETPTKPGAPPPAAPEAKTATSDAKTDKPTTGTDAKLAVAKPDYVDLVGKLASPDWRTREAAQKDLCKADHEAVPHVMKALRDEDPERVRRAETVMHHMLRNFSVPELMQSPQLLSCLPYTSVEDRRTSANENIEREPKLKSGPAYLKSLMNEAEFLRLNPTEVTARIKYSNKQAADEENVRPEYREMYKRYAASLEKIGDLASALKVDYIVHCDDAKEKTRLALETLQADPKIVDRYLQKGQLQKAGMLQDPEFADAWVLAGGNPNDVGGTHRNWTEIEAFLEKRVAEQKKLSGNKDTAGVAEALHILATANERQGNLDKAIDVYKDELRIMRGISPNTASIRSNLVSLGHLEVKAKHIDDGIKTFEEISVIDQKVKDQLGSDPNYATQKLIELYGQKGDHRKVIEKEEMAIRDGSYKYAGDKLAERHRNIASQYETLKDPTNAEKHFLEGVKVKTEGGTDLPWAAADFMALAAFYQRHDRSPEAESLYRRTVAISQNDRFSRDCAPAMRGLVSCLEKTDPKNPEIVELRSKIAARERK